MIINRAQPDERSRRKNVSGGNWWNNVDSERDTLGHPSRQLKKSPAIHTTPKTPIGKPLCKFFDSSREPTPKGSSSERSWNQHYRVRRCGLRREQGSSAIGLRKFDDIPRSEACVYIGDLAIDVLRCLPLRWITLRWVMV